MQVLREKVDVTISNKRHLSGYDLTTYLIRGGLGKLGLNGNAKEVLLYLASCYNEKNGTVYPRVKTISEAMGISERGVIRALAELTETGCIMRSKRGKNTNVYVITQKVLNSNSRGHNGTTQTPISNDKMTPSVMTWCHYHEHEIKELEVKQHAKVVSFKKVIQTEAEKEAESSSTIASASFETKVEAEIPDILKRKAESGEIKNLIAYWRSLRPQIQQEYIEQDKEEKNAERQREEWKRLAEAERQAKIEAERKLREELDRPLEEQWTKETAIRTIQTFKRMGIKSKLAEKLAKVFEIDVTKL